jgi:hypothetical protein
VTAVVLGVDLVRLHNIIPLRPRRESMTDQPQWDDPKASKAAAKAYAKAQRPLYKKKRVIIPAAFVAIAVFSSATGGGDTPTTEIDTVAEEAQAPVEAEAPAEAAPVETEAPAEPAEPAETSGQRNAKKAAANYLNFTAFSRDGLIQQLSSDAGDGYSVEDATYGVDAQNADWNEQAYKAAKNYLSITAFSRQGLIEQLSSSAGDKYTIEQATYGADKALAE